MSAIMPLPDLKDRHDNKSLSKKKGPVKLGKRKKKVYVVSDSESDKSSDSDSDSESDSESDSDNSSNSDSGSSSESDKDSDSESGSSSSSASDSEDIPILKPIPKALVSTHVPSTTTTTTTATTTTATTIPLKDKKIQIPTQMKKKKKISAASTVTQAGTIIPPSITSATLGGSVVLGSLGYCGINLTNTPIKSKVQKPGKVVKPDKYRIWWMFDTFRVFTDTAPKAKDFKTSMSIAANISPVVDIASIVSGLYNRYNRDLSMARTSDSLSTWFYRKLIRELSRCIVKKNISGYSDLDSNFRKELELKSGGPPVTIVNVYPVATVAPKIKSRIKPAAKAVATPKPTVATSSSVSTDVFEIVDHHYMTDADPSVFDDEQIKESILVVDDPDALPTVSQVDMINVLVREDLDKLKQWKLLVDKKDAIMSERVLSNRKLLEENEALRTKILATNVDLDIEHSKLEVERSKLDKKIKDLVADKKKNDLKLYDMETDSSAIVRDGEDMIIKERELSTISVKIDLKLMGVTTMDLQQQQQPGDEIKIIEDEKTVGGLSLLDLVNNATKNMKNQKPTKVTTSTTKSKHLPDTTYELPKDDDDDNDDDGNIDVDASMDVVVSKIKDTPTWEIADDVGGYIPMYSDVQLQVEANWNLYQSNPINCIYKFTRSNVQYSIDWTLMEQQNVATSKIRSIKRTLGLIPTQSNTVVVSGQMKGLSNIPWPTTWLFLYKKAHQVSHIIDANSKFIPTSLQNLGDVDIDALTFGKIPKTIPMCYMHPSVRYVWIPPAHSIFVGISKLIAEHTKTPISPKFKITKVLQVQNPMHTEAYDAEAASMKLQIATNSTGCKNMEVPIFQTSSFSNMELFTGSHIVRGWRNNSMGHGYYVNADAGSIIDMANKNYDMSTEQGLCMLVGTALVGRVEEYSNSTGRTQRHPKTLVNESTGANMTGVYYHSTTNNINDPQEYNLWYQRQCLYSYVVFWDSY